jgi:hypothetical protein
VYVDIGFDNLDLSLIHPLYNIWMAHGKKLLTGWNFIFEFSVLSVFFGYFFELRAPIFARMGISIATGMNPPISS